MDELTPPVPRYEQLADILRRRIFDGTWPDDASGPTLGREYKVSQPVVQRAFEGLAREGLLGMESGKRTTISPRTQWRVEFAARLPAEGAEAIAASVVIALAAVDQPAFTNATAERIGDGLRLRMTVESASIGGAVVAALPVAQQVLGSLPIVAMSAAAA